MSVLIARSVAVQLVYVKGGRIIEATQKVLRRIHELSAAAAMALAGGLALKWAIVYAGRTSAVESNSARIAADCMIRG